jgi:shikimate dehydrogenase
MKAGLARLFLYLSVKLFTMTTYGIIGYPLTHSFSPGYFNEKFAREGIDARYESFPLKDISEFPLLLKQHPTLRGLNVTIPYKETILPYLDEIDEAAGAVGAVNCIAIDKGKTKGYNTDITGFEQSLKPLLKPHHQQAFVLGTGGSSKAVAYVLDKLGIEYMKISRVRKPDTLSYDSLMDEMFATHTLIVNTTPLGMYPDITSYPLIPYDVLGPDHLLYDLVYNPPETKFLALGKEHGAATKNGLEMLHLQAEASWEIWERYRPTV